MAEEAADQSSLESPVSNTCARKSCSSSSLRHSFSVEQSPLLSSKHFCSLNLLDSDGVHLKLHDGFLITVSL